MSAKRQPLNFSQYVPNNKVLEKKVPENPRYKHVKPAINSGKNVRRYIDSLKEQQKNANLRKDEVFKRIKLSSFVKLAVAVFLERFHEESATDKNSDGICQDDSENLQKGDESKATNQPKPRSPFCSVLMGVGELDLRNERQKQLKPIVHPPKADKKLPWLLLDVRDRDEYLQSHITTAKSYPAAMLSRSLGYETRELQLYKNIHGELIILYDDDEMTAARVAKTLVERGYENVFLLSGGLKLAMEKFPHGLISGICPAIVQSSVSSPSRRSSEVFTQEDIHILRQCLEEYLCPPKDTGPGVSSRSRASSSRNKPSNYGSSKKLDDADYQSTGLESSVTFKSANQGVPNFKCATDVWPRPLNQTAKQDGHKWTKNPPWK